MILPSDFQTTIKPLLYSKDMFSNECTKSGITFSLRFRDPNTTVTPQSTMDIITPHFTENIGFRVAYSGQEIHLGIWANTFDLGCAARPINIYEWNHFVISIRIRPTLRMFCFHNGELFAGNGNYGPKTGGGKAFYMMS